VHEVHDGHTAVAAAIGRGEPPPPVRTPIDVDHLDAISRELVAQPQRADPWAERGVVEILRTRALIAEITFSLVRVRDLVAARAATSPQPESTAAVAAPA
jgi:hypothetical protein